MANPIKQPLPIQITRRETATTGGNFNALSSQVQSAPTAVVTPQGQVTPQLVGVDLQTVTQLFVLNAAGALALTFQASFTGLPQNFRIRAGQAVFLDVVVALTAAVPLTMSLPVITPTFGSLTGEIIRGPQTITSPAATVQLYVATGAAISTPVIFAVRGTLYGLYTAS